MVQIFHNRAQSPFDQESGLVCTLEEFSITPDVVFHKQRHSALAGTGLGIWLRERGITHLIISGIRTEQCCETTTRDASDQGFEVDFVSEATHTFTMEHASGRCFSPEDIRIRTELVLAGRFARIVTVNEVLGKMAAKDAA